MTTRVIVSAHCDPDTTVVEVRAANFNDKKLELIYLVDGQVKEFDIYDERSLNVRETSKSNRKNT